MLDLRRLRLLRELAIRGTIAGVAEALAYSPSSVSQQLAVLEREAGVPLLRKSGRRVQLTPQAEILVEHTTALLERLEQAEADVTSSLGSVTGTLRLAVFQSAALGIVPQALTLFADEFPDLRVEVTQREPESALSEVEARDFDLVIAEQYPGHAAPRPRDLDRVDLSTDEIRLAVPPRPSRFGPIDSMADAGRVPWVMEPKGTASRHWAEQLCRVTGFEPDVRFETADLQAHIRLIESGNAVALLPDLVWAGREPTVRMLRLAGRPSRTIFTAVRAGSRARPAVLAARDVLARAVA